jgi:hypothetical protein
MTECCLDNSLGYLQVPTGAAGATGATGATGAAGANGTNGTNGTNGSDGTSVLFFAEDFGNTDATTGSDVTAFTYAMPANELSAVGDEIEIVAEMQTANINNALGTLMFAKFDGNSVAGALFQSANQRIKIISRVKRVNSNTIHVSTEILTASTITLVSAKIYTTLSIGSIDFTQINDIDIVFDQTVANYIVYGQMTVYKYKA